MMVMRLSTPLFDQFVHALQIVLPLRSPAEVSLKFFFRDHPELGSQDRAFIADSVYALLRRRHLLESLAPQGTPREMALLALLKLVGVSLRELQPLLRNGEEAWLAHIKGQAASALPLAIQAEFPDWLVERLRSEMSDAEILALGRAMQEPAPLDLRVNTLLAKREDVLAKLKEDGIAAVPTRYSPTGVRLLSKIALNHHPLFVEGKIEVQDEGSQLLALLLEPRRRDMVVDFCAGGGGKTLLLGALMQSQGRLYAFDVAEKRLANLKPRLARSGLSNVHAQRIEHENDTKVKRLRGKIDRVLVDAPCSGLGRLRRNPDLKWRQTPQEIAEWTKKQASILTAASGLVKPGGRLVYGTCSFLREENEAIVEGFLGQHADFSLGDAQAVMARQRIDLSCGQLLRLTPHQHGTDGFFAAILERREAAA
jgi:16S rRNA (cytosine967-C5)-methyltransferase